MHQLMIVHQIQKLAMRDRHITRPRLRHGHTRLRQRTQQRRSLRTRINHHTHRIMINHKLADPHHHTAGMVIPHQVNHQAATTHLTASRHHRRTIPPLTDLTREPDGITHNSTPGAAHAAQASCPKTCHVPASSTGYDPTDRRSRANSSAGNAASSRAT